MDERNGATDDNLIEASAQEVSEHPDTLAAPFSWERLLSEPAKSYQRFALYLQQGPTRTLLGTYNVERATQGKEPQPRASGAWHRAFKEWNWKERAEAWDEWQLQQREEELAARRREIEAAREQRVEQFQERAWNIAERILDTADKMLDFPLIQKRVETKRELRVNEEGQPYEAIIHETVIEPARWNFNSVARLTATADNVARLSCDMATARLVHEAANMSNEELLAEAAALEGLDLGPIPPARKDGE